MQIIGVIDLRAGVAVHARGGARAEYRPVPSPPLGPSDAGNPVALGRLYRGNARVTGIYVADLDAIAGGPAQSLDAIAAVGLPLWVDAGVGIADQAGRTTPAASVVVGLETLASFDDLTSIARTLGIARTVFSLDLRAGIPITRPDTTHAAWSPIEIVRQAARCGVRRVIMLDLARVGQGIGVDLDLFQDLRSTLPAPDFELMVGGGIRGNDDLQALERLGCDGALVATAFIAPL